jgi:hypothetical protein
MALDPSSAKTDNHPASREAKIELRTHVLEHVDPAHVFDAFCGTGEMHRSVWKDAASYVGCDQRSWARTHPPRYVGANQLVMRSIDLQRFNVFDLDAYGSPWEQVAILLGRRTWAPGERGGLILTDGSSLKLRWGGIPNAMAWVAGLDSTRSPASTCGVTDLMAMALAGFVKKANLNVLRMWQAEGVNARVYYTSIVFEGTKG